ncbi:hypothetical protein IJ135_01465 [Candidatus Saccharibacteria bacterium]|nr:hypothetical protein [Candidatus Saccharibacteria bacterium]
MDNYDNLTNPMMTQPGAMQPDQAVQPVQNLQPDQAAQLAQPTQPAQLTQPGVINSAGVAALPDPNKKDVGNIIKIVAIVVLSLISVTFIGLFIWMSMQYNDASTDLAAQIKTATDAAVDANTMELEAEFAEREKDPYRDFAGPVDYGQLSFKYPKTWSLYIAADAAFGGDYYAYFNPIEVNAVSNTTINALRVMIFDRSFEAVAAEYQTYLTRENSNLVMDTVSVGGALANRYIGTIPNTELSGIIVIFKIRDKTAMLRTDAMIFEGDFNKVLETVTFNA